MREPITLDNMEFMEVEGDKIFWRGHEIKVQKQVSLGAFERILAGLAALATVIAAAFPIAVHFKIF